MKVKVNVNDEKMSEFMNDNVLANRKIIDLIYQSMNDNGYVDLQRNVIDDSIIDNQGNVLPSDILNAMLLDFNGIKSDTFLMNAFNEIIDRKKRHPIYEWLESLVWNGVDNIAKLASFVKDEHDFIVYDDKTEKSVFHAILEKWIIGCVAKAYCQYECLVNKNVTQTPQNVVMILGGKQGIGKSTFVRFLSSAMYKYFSDGSFNPDDKEIDWRLAQTWIWELSELGQITNKKDSNVLKHKLTQDVSRYRLPYAKTFSNKPCLTSFIATTNESEFLVDHTGNRRFFAINIDSIDFKYQSIDMTQVWAQAVFLFKQNKSGAELLPVEKETQNILNAQEEKVDIASELINEWFEVNLTKHWRIKPYVLGKIFAGDFNHNQRFASMAIANTLKQAGVKKVGHGLTYRGIRFKQENFTLIGAKWIDTKGYLKHVDIKTQEYILESLTENM